MPSCPDPIAPKPTAPDPVTHAPTCLSRGLFLAIRAIAVLRDAQGVAAVEFALLLPTVVALLIGMFDYGSLAYQTMEVNSAAQAGADYALINASGAWNVAAVETRVTSATSLSVSASPAPTLETACVTGGVLVVTTGSTCPSGGSPGTYAVVSAEASFTPMFAWARYIMPSTITARAVVRIE